MPMVTVEAFEGRTVEQKRSLVKDITEAVVKNFKVTPEDVHIILYDLRRENVAKAGKLHADS